MDLNPPVAPDPDARPPGRIAALFDQGQGLITALISTVLAFLLSGIVVLATGHDPINTYKGIWNGTGLSWLFPWTVGDDRANAAFNLQQTLLTTTTLILTGLAVAFAFRCGLFNIGGQGQWIVGATMSAWVGSSWAHMFGGLHAVLTLVIAAAAGAAWAGIAGFLKATRGTHEVISTIMLNWIATFGCMYLVGDGGPLQNTHNAALPVSNDVVDSVKLPVFWGDPVLQGLHIGFFVALAMLVTYWLTLSRTTLGFRVRAVGRNPEAARYGGISVGRSYFTAMAISGAFAGLGGGLDILGWQFRISTLDIRSSQVGFIGIAVALLGRNTPIGVGFAGLLFGALLYGTSSRSLDPNVFDPRLAGNLSMMIQALVLLFIGADVVILWLWKSRRLPRLRLPTFRRRGGHGGAAAAAHVAEPTASDPVPDRTSPLGERLITAVRARVPRGMRAVVAAAWVLGLLAAWVSVPPLAVRAAAVPIVLGVAGVAMGAWAATRGLRRQGITAAAAAVLLGVIGVLATHSGMDNLNSVVVWSALTASMLRYATPLIFTSLGGLFSERSGVVNIGLEGMMLTGAFFGILGAQRSGSWVVGVLAAILAGAVMALIHAVISIHLRADQIVSGTAINFLASGVTGYLFIQLYGPEGTPADIPGIPTVHLGFIKGVPYFGDAFGDLNLMIWVAFALVIAVYFVVFRTPFGLRLRAVGEHPRAAETLGLSVYGTRYTGVLISGVLAALGGAFLSIGFENSFNENMTGGAGFIALAALIFGNWHPRGAFLASLLFGFSSAVADRLPVYSDSAAVLFTTVPYILTLIAVGGVIGRPRPPAAVGIPYVRS
ncbi:MAG: hypothetical protein U0Y82_05235 [Thermoleophilia bacterium]